MRHLIAIAFAIYPLIAFADGLNTKAKTSFTTSDEGFSEGSKFRAVIIRGDVGTIMVRGVVGKSTETSYVEKGKSISRGKVKTSALTFRSCQRLRGEISCSSRKFGGVFINGSGEKTLLLPVTVKKQRGAKKGTRAIDLFLIIKDGSVEVRSKRPAPSKREGSPACEMLPSIASDKVQRRDSDASLAATDYLTLTIHADSKLYSLFGASTADIIAIALQSVASIYQSQLGLELRVLDLTIFTDASSDPFSSSTTKDHVQFLGEYLSYVISLGSSSADLFHLLTSQKGFQGAIGVAYTGAACNSSFNAGFSDYSSGLAQFIVTIAHEVGHGLNANHDNNDTASIMSGNGGARSKDPYFSNFSKGEILPFVNSISSSCLLDSIASPPPTPSVPSIKRPGENARNVTITIGGSKRSSSRGTVRGTITVKKISSSAGRVVELRAYPSFQLQKITKTNRRGGYSFSVRPSGSYYVVDRMSRKGSNLARF